MAEVIFADPTTTQEANTQKVLSILPPLQELPPAPAPEIPRPIDNHAKPHTLPPIQQQIQETAQPYRPPQPYDGLPSGGSLGSANALKAAQLTRGQQNAQDEAVAQLAYAAGYALVGAYDAITSQYSDNSSLLFPRDPVEDASYEFGHKAIDLVKDAVDKGRDVVKDLRDNPPHFDIPRPQIPKIERPEIPEFKFPELPEFKIPEFKIPEFQDKDKPNPDPKINKPKYQKIPTDLERQLRELDLSHCGRISFSYSFVNKYLGEYFVQNAEKTGGYFQQITVPSSLDEAIALIESYYREYLGIYSNINKVTWVESGGGTGEAQKYDLGGGITYNFTRGIGNRANRGGNPYAEGYPYIYASDGGIEITGLTTKTAINSILDSLNFGGNKPEIYKLQVSSQSNKDCPLGKPPPPPDPPEPDEDCNCMAKCCPDIDYRKIKAFIDEAISKLDLVAAIPMSWQIRNEGNRPQLIIQCAEENGVDKEGNKKYKSAMYPISVPHWDGSASDKISLPSYIKGNYEGIYTLSDNSKVTINAKNEIECKRILNAIKPHVSKQYLKDAYFKGGVIVRDKPIKESRVKPRYGRYFKDGQKNNKPDWRVDFT